MAETWVLLQRLYYPRSRASHRAIVCDPNFRRLVRISVSHILLEPQVSSRSCAGVRKLPISRASRRLAPGMSRCVERSCQRSLQRKKKEKWKSIHAGCRTFDAFEWFLRISGSLCRFTFSRDGPTGVCRDWDRTEHAQLWAWVSVNWGVYIWAVCFAVAEEELNFFRYLGRAGFKIPCQLWIAYLKITAGITNPALKCRELSVEYRRISSKDNRTKRVTTFCNFLLFSRIVPFRVVDADTTFTPMTSFATDALLATSFGTCIYWGNGASRKNLICLVVHFIKLKLFTPKPILRAFPAFCFLRSKMCLTGYQDESWSQFVRSLRGPASIFLAWPGTFRTVISLF